MTKVEIEKEIAKLEKEKEELNEEFYILRRRYDCLYKEMVGLAQELGTDG